MSVMMKSLEDQIFRTFAPKAIRHLSPPDIDSENPTTRAVLDQAATEFQVAPPLTIHISDPALLAGVWHAIREAYVVNPASRAMREAVAASISTLNTCPYCVTVHESMFVAAGGARQRTGAGTPSKTKIKAARDWAGATLSPGSATLNAVDLDPDDIPQIYGTAAMFHYVNRMVSVFLDDSPMPLPGVTSGPGQKLARAAFAIMSKRMATVDVVPGQSAIRKTGPLPVEFDWATANQHVADALAHFAQAAEKAGEQTVPSQVRQIVCENLANWHGEAAPLSRAWVENEIAPLKEKLKPAARLAMLAARAPWQVDDALIATVRDSVPGDKALVQITGWAAYAATRRIAGWFPRKGGRK